MERSLSRTSALVLFIVTLAAGILLAGTVSTPCAQALELLPIDPLPIDLTPDVQSVSPADDATEVLLTTNVIAYFDRAMLSATIDEDSFYLTYPYLVWSGGHYLKMPIRVDADVTVAADKKSATLNPDVNLEAGRTYTAHLTDDIKAMWGTLGPYTLTDSPYTWSFTTVTRPEIASRIPAADAANVPLNQVISVTFSKAVTGVAPASLYLEKTTSGIDVAAGVSYNAGTWTATITPSAPLDPNTSYRVTVTSAVKSSVGSLSLADAPVMWTFTTGVGNPTVLATTPSDGAVDVPVNQTVTATFSTAMDAATITGSTFFIKKSGGTPLAAAVSYNAATQTASLNPTADLQAGTTYLVTLTAGIEGATGDALDGAPLVWSFTTAEDEEPATDAFTDVDGSPYYDAIYGMRDAGIIDGYQVEDTWQFRPNNTVYRAQFTKMICGVMSLTVVEADWPDPAVPFTDLGDDLLPGPGVVNSLYPHEYVAVAYHNQITNGLTATGFGPYVGIKRAQVVTMMVRAVDTLHPGLLLTPGTGYGTLGNFDATHGANMSRAEYNGLLAGLAGFGPTWSPWAYATRGETAQMLWNLMGLLE